MLSIIAGTAPGQRDAADYVTVGSATHWLFTGLTLENGNTYYVTVRGEGSNCNVCSSVLIYSVICFTAVDHVRYGVTASSGALTVDTTPPTQGQILIEGGETGYITGHLKGHWTGFGDKESGIASYQWCIGSGPGHDDAITCTHTTASNFEPSVSNRLYPGHAYYITVKVIIAFKYQIFSQNEVPAARLSTTPV